MPPMSHQGGLGLPLQLAGISCRERSRGRRADILILQPCAHAGGNDYALRCLRLVLASSVSRSVACICICVDTIQAGLG